jgi:hypothetical protein
MKKLLTIICLTLITTGLFAQLGSRRRLSTAYELNGYLTLLPQATLPATAPLNSLVNHNDTVWVKRSVGWEVWRNSVNSVAPSDTMETVYVTGWVNSN